MNVLNIISFVLFGFLLIANVVQSSESAFNLLNKEVSSQNVSTLLDEIKTELKTVSHISKTPKLREKIAHLLFNSSEQDLKNHPEGLNGTGPIVVTVTAYIQNIDDIDDTKMDYTVRFIYRQSWIDNRFIFGEKQMANKTKYLLLNDEEAQKIWTPDLYFSNEKSGTLHTLIKPNTFTRIYPHGLVLQSFKLSLQLKCRMGLGTFPLDTQRCPIKITSYGYVKDEVEVQWKQNHPVDMRPRDLKMPYFRLGPFDTDIPCKSVTATGEYSCIILRFTFYRKFSLYLILLYIPSTLIVFVSWASFWVHAGESDARFAIGVGTILGLVTQTYVATKDSPPTSYIKASDLWIGICQITVFSAFLEYCLVNYLFRRQESKKHGYDCFEKFVEFILVLSETFVKILVMIWEFIVCTALRFWNFLIVLCGISSSERVTTKNQNNMTELLENVQTVSSDKVEEESTETDSSEESQPDISTDEEESNIQPNPDKNTSRAEKLAKRIDQVSRRLFPIMFILFTIFYWPFYIIKANSR